LFFSIHQVARDSNRGAAIDLGVRVAASLSIEGVGQARHFAAREMLKDWNYWGRRIAQHMQELAGRGRKSSLKLWQLYAMRTAAVGTTASHAGQTQLYLTPLHAKLDTIKSLVANVRAALGHVARFAEQFPKLDRWRELLRYICARITASTPLQRRPIAAIATG
jgi:hypothetical protein